MVVIFTCRKKIKILNFIIFNKYYMDILTIIIPNKTNFDNVCKRNSYIWNNYKSDFGFEK